MVNAKLCENVRKDLFFESLKHFALFSCETEISKCLKCKPETFRVQVLRHSDIIFFQTNKQIGTLRLE